MHGFKTDWLITTVVSRCCQNNDQEVICLKLNLSSILYLLLTVPISVPFNHPDAVKAIYGKIRLPLSHLHLSAC